MKAKKLGILLATLVFMSAGAAAHADWNFGIGTGPQLLKVKGDIGMNTALGPADLSVDLDPDDIADLTETAFGLGVYATDGEWLIQASGGKLQLEEEGASGTRTGGTLSAKLEFDITGFELNVGYPIYQNDTFILRPYTGLRYTRHEFDLSITGDGFVDVNRSKSIDESWTDVLIGLSADVPFAKKWNWNVKADAGFGGSEGTYLASTGLTWRFWRGFSATLFGKYVAVEYENAGKGDSDWYLYDVDESTLGLNIMYNW